MEYVYLSIGWLLFGAVHSFLASPYCKNSFQKIASNYGKYYRILYNVIAIFTFIGLLYYQANIKSLQLFTSPVLLKIGGNGIAVLGTSIILLALTQYNLAEFTGFDALYSQGKGNYSLRTTRLLAIVRHPLYTGTLLLLWGNFLASPTVGHLIIALFLSSYIRIGIHFEEKKLLTEFGEEYRRYKDRVPMLFPRLLKQ